MLSYQQALEIVLQQNLNLNIERINIDQSFGRVLAQSIVADRDYPPFNRSAMDGFAINVSDFQTSEQKFEIIGELLAGQEWTGAGMYPNGALRIMTGASVPNGFNAVVKIEDCVLNGSQVQFNLDTVTQFQNIASRAEDAAVGQEIVKKHTVINLGTIVALASVGCEYVEVYKQPKVSIITSGNEVVAINANPSATQIRNSNVHVLKAGLLNLGITNCNHVHVLDDPEEIKNTIARLQQTVDLIICTGGVSAGTADFLPQVLGDLQYQTLFHKIKIKPGKPIWFGKNNHSNTFVFALPGNPLSVLTTFKILVEPFLLKLQSKNSCNFSLQPTAHEIQNNVSLDEFFFAKADGEGISKIITHGSGDVVSAATAQGMALHEAEKTKLFKDERIKVFKF
jgi:molybdopterin molybdotransferase